MPLEKGNYMIIKEVVDYVERKTGRKANIKLPTHYQLLHLHIKEFH